MYIKSLTGAYAGQVRDIAFDAAKRLIDTGQAVAVDYNPTATRSERVESVSIEGKSVSAPVAESSGPKLVPIAGKSSKKNPR